MRLPIGLILIVSPFFVFAQDSLQKPYLRLFDVSLRLGFGVVPEPKLTLQKVSSFTTHKEFANENFFGRYSDTARRHLMHEWLGPNTTAEIGLNASFKIVNTRSRILKRIRPCLGFYLSDQSLFEYGVGFITRTPVDSMSFINPGYPAYRIDSVASGELYYNYRSKHACVEVGANYDIVLNPHFIAYSGLLLGIGTRYENSFSVRKYEGSYLEGPGGYTVLSGTTLDTTFFEPRTMSSRFTIPLGIHNRFTIKRKYALSFLLEARPGIELYKIKNEKAVVFTTVLLNVGLRFYFRYFK